MLFPHKTHKSAPSSTRWRRFEGAETVPVHELGPAFPRTKSGTGGGETLLSTPLDSGDTVSTTIAASPHVSRSGRASRFFIKLLERYAWEDNGDHVNLGKLTTQLLVWMRSEQPDQPSYDIAQAAALFDEGRYLNLCQEIGNQLEAAYSTVAQVSRTRLAVIWSTIGNGSQMECEETGRNRGAPTIADGHFHVLENFIDAPRRANPNEADPDMLADFEQSFVENMVRECGDEIAELFTAMLQDKQYVTDGTKCAAVVRDDELSHWRIGLGQPLEVYEAVHVMGRFGAHFQTIYDQMLDAHADNLTLDKPDGVEASARFAEKIAYTISMKSASKIGALACRFRPTLAMAETLHDKLTSEEGKIDEITRLTDMIEEMRIQKAKLEESGVTYETAHLAARLGIPGTNGKPRNAVMSVRGSFAYAFETEIINDKLCVLGVRIYPSFGTTNSIHWLHNAVLVRATHAS
jgi:hypothetical protein